MSARESTTSALRLVVFRLIADKPRYGVSIYGNVWCAPNRMARRWHRLNPYAQTSGHMVVFLGKHNRRYVHRLVLETFVGPCPEGMECRHLDGNPANNNLRNLAWGTPQENAEDKIGHGKSGKGESSSQAILSEDDVREVMAMRRAGKTMKAIARWFSVCTATVEAICRGRSWTHVTGLPPYQPGGKPGRPKGRAAEGLIIAPVEDRPKSLPVQALLPF